MKPKRPTPLDSTKTFVGRGEGDDEYQTAVTPQTSTHNQASTTTRDDSDAKTPQQDAPGANFAAPETFGKFALLETLGSGGAGEVYRAVHVRLRKQVALKVLSSESASDERAQQRFAREVRLLCGLEHPNLARMETAGQHDGLPYLVMEYVDGIDLAKLVTKLGPLPVADACQLIGQAALGLDHLHQKGLVHRDIKPSNLIVTARGAVKVVDFGLVRAVDSSEEVTPANHVVGNVHYLAPEAVDPGLGHLLADIRADIYGLGCTLFTLLAGHPPFQDAEPELTKILTAKVRCHPPSLAKFRDDLPSGLSKVVSAMLARDPRVRIGTPMEVVAALAPFADGCDVPTLVQRAELTPAATVDRGAGTDTAEYLQQRAEESGEMQRQESQRSQSRRELVVVTVILLTLCALPFSFWLPGYLNRTSTAVAAGRTATEESGSKLANPRPNQTFPLLPTIETDRDAFDLEATNDESGWTFSNLEEQKRGILQLPVRMPQTYSLEFTVERLEGQGSFGIGFSAGDARMMALLDHGADDVRQSGMFFIGKTGRAAIRDGKLGVLLPDNTPVRFRLDVSSTRAQLVKLETDAGNAEVAVSSWIRKDDPEAVEKPETEPPGPFLGPLDAFYPNALFLHVLQGSFRIHDLAVTVSESGKLPTAQPFLGEIATEERRLAERIVWRGGHVNITVDSGTPEVHSLKSLTEDPWLLGVKKCDGSPRLMIGDRELRELSKIRDIRTLDLLTSNVTGEALAAVNGMQSLELLAVGGPEVGGDVLASLRDLPRLQQLQLFSMQLSEEDLMGLDRFPQLRKLCLSGSSVSDDAVEEIVQQLPDLEHLCIGDTLITGTCLLSVGSLKRLQHLDLSDLKIGDEVIDVLLDLPALKTVVLSNTDITKAALERLREENPNLKVIP